MTVPELGDMLTTVWVLLASFLVFMMHLGFAMVEIGFTRSKNAINILMKNVATVAIGALCYFFLGFALMFGESAGGLFGTSGFALRGIEGWDDGLPGLAFWVFQAMFAATAATIVSGAVAERVQFRAYLAFTVVMTAVIYPVVGHWVWSGQGWLGELGFIDFAGSTVVHSVGAWGALVFASLLGARMGRYDSRGLPRPIFGHSIPLGTLGVLVLWFGWFGFNGGSTLSAADPALASVIAVTMLGGAAGGLAALAMSSLLYGKSDASLTLNGILAGLVSITAGAHLFHPAVGILVGAVGGILLVLAISFFDRLHVDDPVGAISVHGVCGVWGTLAIGLLAPEVGLLAGGGAHQFVVQAIGVCAVLLWTAAASVAALLAIKAVIGLRTSPEEELEGLDLAEHGMMAYGDLVISAMSNLRHQVNTYTAETRPRGSAAVAVKGGTPA